MPLRSYLTALLLSLLAGFLGWLFCNDWAAFNWSAVPCQIVRSQPRPVAGGFLPDVEYHYEIAGLSLTGRRFSLGRGQLAYTRDQAEKQLKPYTPGPALCYVNPSHAEESCLIEPEAWSITLLPLLLVLWMVLEHVPLSELWLRRRRRQLACQPLSRCNDARGVRPLLILLLLLSLLGSAGLVWLSEIGPRHQVQRAAAWSATACQMERSRVKVRWDYHGPNYELDVSYAYAVAGVTYHGNQLAFGPDTYFGYSGAEQMVAAYPEQSLQTCFVNPQNPRLSVLNRDFHAHPGFRLVIVALLLLGPLLIWESMAPLTRPMPSPLSGSRSLRPRKTPGRQLLLYGCALLGCAASVWWMTPAGWQDLRRGYLDLLPLVYGLVAWLGAAWSAHRCVRLIRSWKESPPLLQIRPGCPRPGESLEITWRYTRQVEATLHLSLELWEETLTRQVVATQHGPHHEEKWQKHCLQSWPVASLDLNQQSQGELCYSLPAECMHSLRGRFFALRWLLVAETQNSRFEYALEVAP